MCVFPHNPKNMKYSVAKKRCFFIRLIIVFICFTNCKPKNLKSTEFSTKFTFEGYIQYLNKRNTIKIVDHFRVKKEVINVIKNRSSHDIVQRAKYYFPLFESKLKAYGLPEELKYLPIVESNLKLRATSRSGAQGLWQFMPSTGKQYGLRKNKTINTFIDPLASTDAACRYLKYLYSELHDWELVLAAYNCGIGRVKSIIRKTKSNNFWEIINYLPLETQNYVPRFLAMNFVISYKLDQSDLLSMLSYSR